MAPGKKKASKSKSKGIGVDFRKVKHKVGRKLPPAQNVTKVEFKSKAIVLPGQSLLQNKDGCAVNQRRQTLKELLGQTTHYSERVRKESLFGIRDLISRHPKELASHSVSVIRNLSARMTDTDIGVRKALLLLFRSTIFPALPQEVMGLLLPIIMAHLSSAMTHLAMDVRLTAVHFLNILLQHYPMLLISSFKIQVLQYYLNYLGKGDSGGEDNSVILVTLKSLVRFLSTLQVDTFANQRKISKFTHSWLQKYDLHTLAPSATLEALHGYKSELSEPASHHAIQSEVSMGANESEKILEGLVSKLLDCWRRFLPEVCSTPNPDSTCLSCMIAVTKALTYIFQNLMRDAKTLSSTQEKAYRSLMHMSSHDGWMVFMPLRKKFLPILLHHLMPVFPMEAPPIHLPKVEDDLIALNVGMCEVLMHVIVPDTVQGDIDGCKDALDAILNYYVQFLHGMMLPSSQLSVSIIDTKLAEPHLKILLHFIPCTVPIVSWKWRDRLLQAFTRVFETSNAQSGTKLVCLSMMTKILSEEFQNSVCMKGTEMVVPLKYQQLWLQSLPKLLWELKHTHPPSSKVSMFLITFLIGSSSL
ncbi:hypothetical protein O6H91_06G083700 [Diphasiastrum complanatum]|uniref:Uncharacterized protein n=1 Tax=Diphasiastrum complanatum TaxID=34168 RepID=A0ACC2DFV9_DIPCM|nr:hypothetical protein O6H91_06G083700 [Diphasiastrum complanatum]